MKKMTFLRNFLFVAATLSLAACGGDDPIDPETTLSVKPDKVLLAHTNGAEGTFSITSNAAWTATESADWFELSDATGTENATVTVTATSENTSSEVRSATVTITAGDKTEDITVEQAGAVTSTVDVYDLKADGTDPAGAVFSLSGTQEGISYTLVHDGEPVGTVLAGTGSAAAFAGNFIDEGVYTARSIANGGYAQTDMNGSFTITHIIINGTPMMYHATEYGMVPGEVYKYDMNADQHTNLANVTTNIQCLENVNGTVYGITYNNSGTNDLVTVDLSTGSLTTIVSSISADGMGLAYNPVDGKTYVSTWDERFGSIDLDTGAFTSISTLDYPFTIAIDNDGVCYAQTFFDFQGGTGSYFGTIDLTDGSFTEIVRRQDQVNYIQNMAIDRETDELYWVMRIVESTPTLVKVDKATGDLDTIVTFPTNTQSIAIVNEGEPREGYKVTPTV